MISIDQIKKLREETAISISECKKALEEANGDSQKAKEILKKWGKDLSSRRTGRGTEQGIIASYIHSNKKIGVLLELACESDFVAKNEDFQNLAHELCLQITAMAPDNIESILEQLWIKDGTKTIQELIQESIRKIGENIVLKRFDRYEI
jgi:elongation factor Ts